MVASSRIRKCLNCGGNRASEPCYPIDGSDAQHYYSKIEYLQACVDTLWSERKERLEYKDGIKSSSAPKTNVKTRRKGGISL